MKANNLKKGMKLKIKNMKRGLVFIVQDWNESCVLLKTENSRAMSNKYNGKFLQYDHTYLPMYFLENALEVNNESK